MASPKDRFILGLMTFGPAEHGARVSSLETYSKCLDYFQQQGYEEVDTARVYVGGAQECFTAKAGWKARGLKLATKCMPKEPEGHSPAALRNSLETSLRELQTDCVDIFYLHQADRTTPFEITLRAIDELYREGKFKEFGISNYTSFEVAEICILCRANGWIRPTVYQAMYNAILRGMETELVPACRRYGLDIVVYNPIAGGLFSGNFKPGDVPADGRFSDNTPSGSRYRQRYFRHSTFEGLRIIESAARKHNLTLIESALRWCVHHSALKIKDGNDGIIIGVSSLEQLQDNLRDLEKGPLPDDVVAAFEEAWRLSKVDTPVYWHRELKYSYDTVKVLFGEGQ